MIMSGFFTPSVLSEINLACTLYKLVLAPAMAMVSGGCLESDWRVSGCVLRESGGVHSGLQRFIIKPDKNQNFWQTGYTGRLEGV